MISGLVWDFGGPVLLTPFELVSIGERNLGLPAGTFTWRGPFEPEADPQWQAFQRGDINEREYWALQAQKFAEVTGRSPEMASMMAPFYAGDEEEIIRPGARTLIRDAKAAGIRVGMHTNDLTSFHDQEWIDRMSILKEFDVVVEGRTDGLYKPDPEAYLLMVKRMGMEPSDIVFIDDQPVNTEGARSIGMVCVHLDPTNPEAGFLEARRLLGLEPR